MNEQDNKVRCNMHLDKKNLEIVKNFIQGTGLSLSSYVDLLVCGAAESIEHYFIKIPPKKTIKKKKSQQIDKIRFNMYLDKRSVGIVKEAVKKAKRTFSAYIDLLISKAANRIQLFYSSKGKKDLLKEKEVRVYYNIWETHKILGLIDYDPNSIFITDEQAKAKTYGTHPFDFSKTFEDVEPKTAIKKNKK